MSSDPFKEQAFTARIADIVVDKGFNFRERIDKSGKHYQDLKAAIQEKGEVTDPLTVVKGADGKLHVCDGEHRYLICLELGIESVKVICRVYANEAERFAESVTRNLLRAKARPYEIAMACDRLLKLGMPQTKIARSFGFSAGHCSALLHCVHHLIPELLDVFRRNDSDATLRQLIDASRMTPEEQMKVFESIKYGRDFAREKKEMEEAAKEPGPSRSRMMSRVRIKATLGELRDSTFVHIGPSRVRLTPEMRAMGAALIRRILSNSKDKMFSGSVDEDE